MSLSTAIHFPTKAQIREIFSHLTRRDAQTFYANYVADNVDWTVMGRHALSGHYASKASFLSESASKIAAVLDGLMKFDIRSVIGGETDDWAVIEMAAANAKCNNGGLRFFPSAD
jgi:hypothetical protein